MAEALLRHVGGDRWEALSAGSQPAGFVHDLAIEALDKLHVPLVDQRSKSWDEFAKTELDVVLTLCDAAASQTCPTWPTAPLTAHWSLTDPAMHPGSADQRIALAVSVAKRLKTKIEGLVALDWSADRAAITERLKFLGDI